MNDLDSTSSINNIGSIATLEPTAAAIGNLSTIDRELEIEQVVELEALERKETEVAVEERVVPPAAPIPAPFPVSIAKRIVSGSYRSTGAGFQLELRVDVDGKRPTKRISGDFYQASGATVTYFGSFVVNALTINVTSTLVTMEGVGSYTFSAGAPKVRVTIPRTSILQRPAAATVRFLTLNNQPGATYICPFQSGYLRTVRYEQDYVQGVTPFVSYNTGSLPSGGPARNLSVAAAYAEAGIGMQTSGVWNEVPSSGAGADSKWSDAELHAAMQSQFTLWKDEPQWAVWLLAAQEHELGPGLLGIMFDQQGKQRQGCAVFHAGIGGTTADKLRLQLYTYVHELGHCFNLLHSWRKQFANPLAPNRPDSLSWMNYPWRYPDGPAAFWSQFPFQFDDLEIIHLRHAFRDNIIMGGNPFIVGAALEAPQAFNDPIKDDSGLELELRARQSFAYGEPVVIEIKLRTTDVRGKRVHTYIHPKFGFVQIGIRKPSGQTIVYEPLMDYCTAEEMIFLDTGRPSIYESAFIGYGKDGFYFDQPGFYQLRAIYYALDGSLVLSNTLTLRIRNPLNTTDEEVAELFFGEEQGMLLYLLGSDILQSGNEAFDLMLERYAQHPLAVYARLVKGINEKRAFKRITPDKQLIAREPHYDHSIQLLSSVVNASEAGQGVDNITLNMTMRSLAQAQKAEGNEAAARATMTQMVDFFRHQSLKPHVLQKIEMQAARVIE
jgi:hypothetical protein